VRDAVAARAQGRRRGWWEDLAGLRRPGLLVFGASARQQVTDAADTKLLEPVAARCAPTPGLYPGRLLHKARPRPRSNLG
jgi:hypothetical protein